jgi:hypothetical protein
MTDSIPIKGFNCVEITQLWSSRQRPFVRSANLGIPNKSNHDWERLRIEQLLAQMDQEGSNDRTAANQEGGMFDSAER